MCGWASGDDNTGGYHVAVLHCACTLILRPLFFYFRLGFSVLSISFGLLSFGFLHDLQLGDSDLSGFGGVFEWYLSLFSAPGISCANGTFSQLLKL